MSQEIIIITGASSGIGAGLARAFAQEGKRLLLVARRQERLQELAQELKPWAEVNTLALDLLDPAAPMTLASHCQAQGWQVVGLINNAGYGKQSSMAQTPAEDVLGMVQLNIHALTHLSRLFLPDMIKHQTGFILNIASTAAFQPVPYFAVYAASKSYVLDLSEALHEEVKAYGVHVAALCPGPVSTEFQEVAGMSPRFFAHSQSVNEVVQASLRLLKQKRAVGWTSLFQKVFSLISCRMPRSLIRKLAGQLMKLSGAR
jgi:uncharacterized protein